MSFYYTRTKHLAILIFLIASINGCFGREIEFNDSPIQQRPSNLLRYVAQHNPQHFLQRLRQQHRYLDLTQQGLSQPQRRIIVLSNRNVVSRNEARQKRDEQRRQRLGKQQVHHFEKTLKRDRRETSINIVNKAPSLKVGETEIVITVVALTLVFLAMVVSLVLYWCVH